MSSPGRRGLREDREPDGTRSWPTAEEAERAAKEAALARVAELLEMARER